MKHDIQKFLTTHINKIIETEGETVARTWLYGFISAYNEYTEDFICPVFQDNELGERIIGKIINSHLETLWERQKGEQE